uniref:Uncharacterized protein n=1 Tax=Romanomermis culicivorax TaxID=13658 RepID=A0A915J4A0_ROMCU
MRLWCRWRCTIFSDQKYGDPYQYHNMAGHTIGKSCRAIAHIVDDIWGFLVISKTYEVNSTENVNIIPRYGKTGSAVGRKQDCLCGREASMFDNKILANFVGFLSRKTSKKQGPPPVPSRSFGVVHIPLKVEKSNICLSESNFWLLSTASTSPISSRLLSAA